MNWLYNLFVGVIRLERTTPCTPCKCASQLRHTPIKCACKFRNSFRFLKYVTEKILLRSQGPLEFRKTLKILHFDDEVSGFEL